jgi:CheY-like chemotaxis protein
MGKFTPTILCVNNNPDILNSLGEVLKFEGYQVVTTQSKNSALIFAQAGTFNLILLDLSLADGSGIELCKEIRLFDKKTPIVFYSLTDPPRQVEEAFQAGAQAYLLHLIVPNVLLETVARFLNHPR